MPRELRFPYTLIRNARGEAASRPLLPIRLGFQGRILDTVGLLDTAADVNVLPYSVGLALGSVWETLGTSVTLSGNLAALEARGVILDATVGQFPPVRLAFAWTRADSVPLLLGQVNFFAEFDVCFFRAQSSFTVRPKSDM